MTEEQQAKKDFLLRQLQILYEAARQARLTASDHEMVKRAALELKKMIDDDL